MKNSLIHIFLLVSLLTIGCRQNAKQTLPAEVNGPLPAFLLGTYPLPDHKLTYLDFLAQRENKYVNDEEKSFENICFGFEPQVTFEKNDDLLEKNDYFEEMKLLLNGVNIMEKYPKEVTDGLQSTGEFTIDDLLF